MHFYVGYVDDNRYPCDFIVISTAVATTCSFNNKTPLISDLIIEKQADLACVTGS